MALRHASAVVAAGAVIAHSGKISCSAATDVRMIVDLYCPNSRASTEVGA